MVRVKICGITNLKDARAAVDCGADALGFVFAESPRKVSVREVCAITSALGPWVSTVGVFAGESPAKIKKIARACGLSAVQLYGDESPKELTGLFPLKVIKAFRVRAQEDLRGLGDFPADAFLFDTKVDGRYGGTGESFDWNLLARIRVLRPVILSGGLDPWNVSRAVQTVRPYGVDVSSGVETSPGKKDHAKVREFILNAKKI